MKLSERADSDLDGTRFRKGVEQFNRGEYWDAHDSWEAIWLSSSGEQKQFIQGLIQLAAVCYHLEKGNERGAGRLHEAAMRRLDELPESFGGIALRELRDDVRGLLARTFLESNGPRIRLTSS